MTGRERVLAALAHEEADRVPTGENQVDPGLVRQILGRPSIASTGREELEALWDGRRDEVVADYGAVHVDLPRALEWDYVRVPAVPAARAYPRPRMTGPYSWLDAEGFEVTLNPEAGNIAVRKEYPDLTTADLPDPEAPVVVDPSELEAVRHVVTELKETHFIVARSPVDGTFPWASSVGMDEFLVRMVTDPEFVRRAIDAEVARSLAYIHAFFDAGADAVMTTDDYSDNRGPVMGAERFRQLILPGLARQCEACHQRGGYFIKHTDGNLWSVLDDFIEIGIDGWHGIQPDIGMDLKRLKERYGERLCFFGGVNCATLIEGTPARAREEVRYAIEHAGPGGGLVVTTSNVIQPGTRLENYRALRQAVRDFGAYPIRLT
ncbi:MAG: uroporphyrinogen decarboxylase family protein [Gemmatimonadota bacterium]